MEWKINSMVLCYKQNVQKTKMSLRITSWKHLLNALLECIMANTEIMHISNGNIWTHQYLKDHNPIFARIKKKKKEDSEKGDKYEAELCKRWDKKLFWRIPIQSVNNIKVIWELRKTSIYWKKGNVFKTEQKEVVLHVWLVASEAEARKPVTPISEEGYYLRPEPVLWQLLSLLSVRTSSLLSSPSLGLIRSSITWLNGSAR